VESAGREAWGWGLDGREASVPCERLNDTTWYVVNVLCVTFVFCACRDLVSGAREICRASVCPFWGWLARSPNPGFLHQVLSHPQLKPTGVFYGAAESKMLHRSTEQNNRRNNVRGGGLSALTSLTWLVHRLCVGQTLSRCLSVRKGTPRGDDETAVFVTTRTSPRFPSLNSSRSSIFVEPVGIEGGGGCGYGAMSATPSRRGKGPGREQTRIGRRPSKGA
jgi:hypothetical protein